MALRTVGLACRLETVEQFEDHHPAQHRDHEDDRLLLAHSQGDQCRTRNIHVRDGITEKAFVAMRKARDATLEVPTLNRPAAD